MCVCVSSVHETGMQNLYMTIRRRRYMFVTCVCVWKGMYKCTPEDIYQPCRCVYIYVYIHTCMPMQAALLPCTVGLYSFLLYSAVAGSCTRTYLCNYACLLVQTFVFGYVGVRQRVQVSMSAYLHILHACPTHQPYAYMHACMHAWHLPWCEGCRGLLCRLPPEYWYAINIYIYTYVDG